MRKDAKIGFAIGAVLLAVLAVYSMVVPKHGKKNTNTVTLVTPPQVSAPAGDGGASAPVVTPANDSQPAAPTTRPVAINNNNSGNTQPPAGPVAGGNPPTPAIGEPVSPPAPPKPDAGNTVDTNRKPTIADGQPHGEFSSVPDALTINTSPAKPPKPSRTHPANLEVPAPSGTTRVYVVQAGQTLSSIAEEIYGNPRFWVAIQRENKSINPNHLHVGDKINLPDVNIVRPVEGVDPSGVTVEPRGGSHTTTVAATVDDVTPGDGHTYKVKSGDNLYKIAKAELGSGRLAEELYELNKDVIGPDKTRLKLGMVLKLPAQPAHLASSMVIP